MRVWHGATIVAVIAHFGPIGPARTEPRDVWFDQTTARISSAVRPPKGVDRLKEARSAVVRFEVGRSGKIDGAVIEKSSGLAELDRAALDAVRAADPLPAPPLPQQITTLTVRAPIRFRPNAGLSLERAKRSIDSICTGC